ncbi:DNA recombination and repair protein RecF [hydrothermal vent metagenome]|uniref:DNA recombination and repair protein RecF n=2 Tax=hydrothermal vent metagenome TaxID=652676 RepID=A0A3B0SI60_9ZZZZ
MSNLVQLGNIKPRNVRSGNGSAAMKMPAFRTPDLFVGRVQLTDFRSYERMTLEPDGYPVVLTGPNGAGKTNILEALSFLSPGRGLRGCRLSDVSRLETGHPEMDNSGRNDPRRNWAVAARLETPDGTTELGTGIISGQEPSELNGDGADSGVRDRRVVRIDGENGSSPAAFGDILQLAWLTPQMDRLFIEAASGRRRFLDRIVANFHSSHIREVNAYERVMRERNRLLQEGSGDISWLGALESRMAEHGVAVAAARLDALARLAGAIEESTTGFPRATLGVDGLLEGGLMAGPALAVEDDFRQLLQDNRAQDGRRGRATAGPHKSDLLVRHRDKDIPAALCSTGEQKALLIGITLASVRITASCFGAAPVLLLDEVVAHLDRTRRHSLFDELATLGSQVWLTGTDRLLFDELGGRARYYRVENSKVTEE